MPNHWRVFRFLSAALLQLALVHAACAQAAASHAAAELIAERDAPEPGEPLWVGLLFRLDPGWHIYWQNPGDSGEPPKVLWHLPKGFRASSFDWPAPIRLGSGSIIDYGYEGQVLLMAPIGVPDGAKTSAIASIAADVKYIVCSDICIPGKAHLTLSLPGSPKAPAQEQDSRGLFQRSRARLPKPSPSNWRKTVVSDKDHIVLTVHGAPPPHGIAFFPLQPGVIENSAPQVLEPAEDGFQLTFKKSDQYTSYPLLRGVLVLDSGRAYQISIMIQARPDKKI